MSRVWVAVFIINLYHFFIFTIPSNYPTLNSLRRGVYSEIIHLDVLRVNVNNRANILNGHPVLFDARFRLNIIILFCGSQKTGKAFTFYLNWFLWCGVVFRITARWFVWIIFHKIKNSVNTKSPLECCIIT